MFTLIITLCLFTTVNTDTSELQVQTVRSGSNVTIKCRRKMDNDSKKGFLAWYKQSLGNVPEYVVRSFGDERKPRFTQSFSNERFTLDEEAFGLIINGIKEEDAGTYFCGKVKQNVIEFESGTLLLFQAVKTDQHPVTEMVIKTGDSVTLQCSVQVNKKVLQTPSKATLIRLRMQSSLFLSILPEEVTVDQVEDEFRIYQSVSDAQMDQKRYTIVLPKIFSQGHADFCPRP
ncbi:hypothetical protein SRHO_G00023030 [Serrasalmus rhombeus]